jgi:hypothetical protein
MVRRNRANWSGPRLSSGRAASSLCHASSSMVMELLQPIRSLPVLAGIHDGVFTSAMSSAPGFGPVSAFAKTGELALPKLSERVFFALAFIVDFLYATGVCVGSFARRCRFGRSRGRSCYRTDVAVAAGCHKPSDGASIKVCRAAVSLLISSIAA